MLTRRKRRLMAIGILLLLVLGVLLVIRIGLSPAPACLVPQRGPVKTGLSARIVHSSGTDRCYLLYAPAAAASGEPLPVVFALHGFAGTAHDLRRMSRWDVVAEQQGFLVVYPNGSGFPLRWNIGPIANTPLDDVQLIHAVLDDLAQTTPVDHARVFVSGFSNGGQMAHRIACGLSLEVAAIGVVDGLDAGMLGDCAAERPVPVIAFFGDSNPLADAEYPGWFYWLVNLTPQQEQQPLPGDPIAAWAAGWAEHNACADQPATESTPQGSRIMRYDACQDNAAVIVYMLAGHGHAWPGGPDIPLLGESTTEIDASAVMWEFFSQHPLTAVP